MLHPLEPAPQPYVTRCLADRTGPTVAATDYIRRLPDQISRRGVTPGC